MTLLDASIINSESAGSLSFSLRPFKNEPRLNIHATHGLGMLGERKMFLHIRCSMLEQDPRLCE